MIMLDPGIKVPMPFLLSIEPCLGDSYMHGFHLGTCEDVAREFAKEIFRRVNSQTCLYTVALMRDGKVWDVWDGSEWASDAANRMWDEENRESA